MLAKGGKGYNYLYRSFVGGTYKICNILFLNVFIRIFLGFVSVPSTTWCSGLLTPDTFSGENDRHIEVFDEQTTTYLHP